MRTQGRPEVPGASAAMTPVQQFESMTWERRRRIARLFPEGEGEAIVGRLLFVASNAYTKMLATSREVVDPRSVMECVVAAAQLGLEAGTDEAYLVPYKGVAQLIVGPQGLIQLAYRSQQIRMVVADVARENDDFDYDLGHPGFIRHKKAPKNRGEIAYAYAFFETVAGGVVRKVLTAEDVEGYRKLSKATSDKSPWFTNFEGMARKTALKRLLSFAPRSKRLSLALAEDDHGAAPIAPVVRQAVREDSDEPMPAPQEAPREEPPMREPGEDDR